MNGSVAPPIEPMLAKLVDTLPTGDFLFEPKWDGFRAIVFRSEGDVYIQSRDLRPLDRYFPELHEALTLLASRTRPVEEPTATLEPDPGELVGRSLAMQAVFKRIALVAPTDASVATVAPRIEAAVAPARWGRRFTPTRVIISSAAMIAATPMTVS